MLGGGGKWELRGEESVNLCLKDKMDNLIMRLSLEVIKLSASLMGIKFTFLSLRGNLLKPLAILLYL